MGMCQSKEEKEPTTGQRKEFVLNNGHYTQGGLPGKLEPKGESPQPQIVGLSPAPTQDTENIPLPQDNKQSFLSDLEIPKTNGIKQDQSGEETGCQPQNSNIENGNNKPPSTILNSIDDITVPGSQQIHLTHRTSSFYQKEQIKVLESNNISLESYKNFSPVKMTDKQGRLCCTNAFECFSRLIFELLGDSDKFHTFKNQLLLVEQFVDNSNISKSVVDYGDVSDVEQVKKMFLQYIVKLHQGETSVQILSRYYVLAGVLQKVIISVGKRGNVEVESKYLDEEYDAEFFQMVADKFRVKFESKGEEYIFVEGEKKLIIGQSDEKFYAEIK